MKSHISILILICSVCLISFGIWNADVPLGDEAGYIGESYGLYLSGQYTINLYKLSYVAIFKCITDDPIIAHYVCRFVTSLCSVILLYFFLKSFSFLKNEYAVLLACVLWAVCKLNIPEAQFGNISLFALNIVLPSLILLTRNITSGRILFLILSLLWASRIRPEYNAPLILASLYFIFHFSRKYLKGCLAPFEVVNFKSVFLSILIIATIFLASGNKADRSFDQYLRLALDQSYASLYSKLNPGEKFSAMVEYRSITDEKFGKGGFKDACANNPVEVSKYLALNGTINSLILVPGLLRHRSLFMPESLGKKGEIVQISFLLVILLTGMFFAAIKFYHGGLRGILKTTVYALFDYNIIFSLILCSASLVAIFLLIPDPRYWISCIPLLFILVCWSIDGLFSLSNSIKVKTIATLAVILILSCPMFLSKDTNRELIIKMRECRQNMDIPPIIAGLYPSSLGTFAFKNDYQVVGVEEFNTGSVKLGVYDFIVIDTYFRNSSFWNKNSEFMRKFEENPSNCNYTLLGTTKDKYQLSVYFHTPVP
jgi:hypothetical protein